LADLLFLSLLQDWSAHVLKGIEKMEAVSGLGVHGFFI